MNLEEIKNKVNAVVDDIFKDEDPSSEPIVEDKSTEPPIEKSKENLKKEKKCDKIMKDDKEDKEDDEDSDEKDELEKKKAKKSMDQEKFEVSKEHYDRLQKALAEDAEKAKIVIEAPKEEPKEEPKLEPKDDKISKSLTDFGDLVKSLSDKVGTLSTEIESLKKQPTREPKSLNGYTPLSKGEDGDKSPKELSKGAVLSVMEELCKSGEIRSNDVIEYELTKSISNKDTKQKVEQKLKSKGLI